MISHSQDLDDEVREDFHNRRILLRAIREVKVITLGWIFVVTWSSDNLPKMAT